MENRPETDAQRLRLAIRVLMLVSLLSLLASSVHAPSSPI